MRASKTIDEIGNRYGRLTVVDFVGYNHANRAVWLCKCDCGNYTKVVGKYLRNGETKSCGCLYKENLEKMAGGNITYHGFSAKGDNCYTLWRSIKKRCRHPKGDNKCYEGITMCDEWLHDFGAFRKWCYENGYEDNRDKPFRERLSIDRIDSSKGYCPENCHFISVSENSTRANIARYHGNTEVSRQIAKG